MDDSEILKILLKFQDYLSLTSIWTAPFRVIGWWFIMGLSEIVDALSGGIDEIYQLINFFDSDPVNDFISEWMPVIFALMALAVGFLGWKIIVQKKNDYDKIITNSLFAITLFLVLPWGMQQASDMLQAGRGALDNDGKLTVSTKIYQNNITDVYKIDKDAKWSTKDFKQLKKKNNISNEQDIGLIDITEPVDTGGIFHFSPLTKEGQAILDKKISDASGKKKLEDLESFWIQDDEAYYRYSWHPFYMMFELGTIAVVLFFTMFKTAQLLMELGIIKIFSVGTSLTDIENGQRNKKFLEKIRNTFIVLFAIELVLQCYILFTDFVGQSDISMPTKIVVLIAAGCVTVDGPNFIEEFFGIDAGLKSIGRSLMGLFVAGKAGKGFAQFGAAAAKGAGKIGGKLAKKTAGAALVGAGAGKGLLDGFKENMRAENGGGSNREVGKDGNTPLSHALADQPTNVMSDETLKEAMLSGSDEQKEKEKNNLSKSDSPLSSMNKEDSSHSSTEPENKEGGLNENDPSVGDHNTPLSNISAEADKEQSRNENGMHKDGNTPLQGLKDQPSAEEASNGLRSPQDRNMSSDKAGNTPLSNMDSEGIHPDRASDRDGETPLSNMPGDGPIPGQSNKNTPGGSDTPLSSMRPTEDPAPGNSQNNMTEMPNMPRQTGTTSVIPNTPLSQSNANNGGPSYASDNGWSSLFKTMPQNIGSHSSVEHNTNVPVPHAPTSNPPINNVTAGAKSIATSSSVANSTASTPTNNILPTHRAAIGSVLPGYKTPAPSQVVTGSRLGYSPKIVDRVSDKPIRMPGHVRSAAEAFRNQMTKGPSTNMTAKDVLVTRYANLAQRIHDSSSVQNSRKAYDIAKNSVTARFKGGSEK
ncbi:hypothetical protein MF621_004156 (plasmid) [Bacillus velezensis]|uniref:pLS20_p028 family conjugation system transmembrane protein n=1 Tax=Bacillus TaxID=1386 RepID=UPI001E533B2C|nr:MULTISPECIES: hypothetical protein [Bacillus amyloliquefaciens group]MED2914211.1 hypothetical protein [Bacillus velezensis]UFD97694.1 Extended VirB6-like [Bacillus amyloliquefaciens]URJ76533.1 hypothetical protein MF619_004175 [Bacillus velezensis]URJ80539.1 hypothetical protein MF621_004156 [Bacillus velezensis]